MCVYIYNIKNKINEIEPALSPTMAYLLGRRLGIGIAKQFWVFGHFL